MMVALITTGCLSAAPAQPADTATPAPLDDAPQGLNLYLLDAPHPYTTRVSGGAEPTILADPTGQYLWIGDTSGLYRSADDGTTWQRMPNPFLPGAFADGHAMALDDAGNLFTADTQGQVIGVARSSDGGSSWDWTSYVTEADAIADRPWLAARGDGTVALVQNSVGRQGETCAMSTDGGVTWTSRSLVNDARPNAGNVIFEGNRLWLSDGANVWRWASPCLNAPLPLPLPASGAQIFTMVQLVAPNTPAVAQPAPGNGQMELRIRDGTSWKSIVVSDPSLKANTFGTLSVHDGEVAVAWYGSEASGSVSNLNFPGVWNVYVARVTDWDTASPTIRVDRLTAEPNFSGGFCMGGVTCGEGRELLDYFGVDHDSDGNVHVAYGHLNSNGGSEVRYATLAASP